LSFTAVSTGPAHTCALATTGAIYCWGSSGDGRLGDGTGYHGLAPIKVAGNVSFTALSAGGAHTCAISTSGDAYCWGFNNAGQLGNGSVSSASTPALVSGGHKFTVISAGDSHTCGIAADGVFCWGDNTFGQVGIGVTLTHEVAPAAIKYSSSFVTVAAGGFHTCAIDSGGGAWCWGDNTTGELGDADFAQNRSGVPIPVSGGLTFKSITVGGTGGLGDYYSIPSAAGHSCAVTTDGVTYCWGLNSQGELGTAALVGSSATPLKVDGQH
jgi:alpha-tubulin suppressor-like RCC1 family protein